MNEEEIEQLRILGELKQFDDSLGTTEPIFDEPSFLEDLERHNEHELQLNIELKDVGHGMSSFEHMPMKFLGLDTGSFGKSINNPFLLLKEMSLSNEIDIDDRIQAVRYMVHIPYKSYVEHCIDSVKSIIQYEDCDIYKRYHFFANNEKFTKLDDHVVHAIHPFFFKYSIEKKYPIELTLLSARYILSKYDFDAPERYYALELVLDIADNVNETVMLRSECADILLTFGDDEEHDFGKEIIESLSDKPDTLYENTQNAHNVTINEHVRKIIRSLRKEYDITKIQTRIDDIQDDVIPICNEEEIEKIRTFLFRIMTDPSLYEQLTLCDIFILVYHKVKSLQFTQQLECIKRIKEEAIDSINTCSTGYLTRIINVLTGFVEGEELELRLSPKEELKSATLARIYAGIRSLPEHSRNDVLESLYGEDKYTFLEFMGIYSPEDELREEYHNILSEKEFNETYKQCIKELLDC